MSDPTSDSTALALVPPAAVPAVTDDQAATQAQNIDPAAKQQIDATVTQYVNTLMSADPHSPAFDQQLNAVHSLGDADIRASAAVSNRLLDRPAAAMSSSGALDSKSQISTSLVKLRRTVEDLDPTQQGLFGKKHLWGTLPFGNTLRDYFHKYESGQRNLDAIIQSLYAGQDELRKDDASLDQEKANVWSIKGRLEQYIYMATALDQQVSAKIASVQTSDPDRAKELQEDVLFYVRQKRQDLLTQLAVNTQGYLAMDLVEKNNQELIKGVDRATTTTVSALRTAIIVAQALANQKLVLNQINALNTTTSNLIESTSEMLKEQSGQVYQQAADSTIQLDKLQTAFNNIYTSIDAIDTYKVQALGNMQKTVDALSAEIDKAQSYLQRAHAGPPAGETMVSSLTVPAAKG
ncbi:MAG TPA: toxic anion resistance protein [Candidatus Dormibacteraeota bacterium]|nr:toxic anion resistance protein [Candidatus Dormibacteraeota bacterium]